jgi:hypothetical protein
MLVTAWQRYVHYFVFMVADAGFRGCGGVRVCGYLGAEKKLTCWSLAVCVRHDSCLCAHVCLFIFSWKGCALACLFIFSDSVPLCRYVSLIRSLYGYTYRRVCVCVCVSAIYAYTLIER